MNSKATALNKEMNLRMELLREARRKYEFCNSQGDRVGMQRFKRKINEHNEWFRNVRGIRD